MAAAVAFYGLLAPFPAIAALISIWALLFDPQQIEQQIEGLSAFRPEAAAIIKEQARTVAADAGGLSLAAAGGILFAPYSASKGMKALMEGLNIIYDEEEERGFIRLNLIALRLTLFIVAMIVAQRKPMIPAIVAATFAKPASFCGAQSDRMARSNMPSCRRNYPSTR
jgi:membrane protein